MSADTIRDALKKLERKGRLTPRRVVDTARVATHPLHDYFDWDDASASDKWRIEQARQMIRSVTVETTTDEVCITSYYHHDPKAGSGQGYVSVPKLRTEKENARSVVVLEFMRAAANMRRAELVAEALGGAGPELVAAARIYIETAQRSVEELPS